MTPPQVDTPSGGLGQSGQPFPAPRVLARQREPPDFSGTDGVDVEDWQVDRVAAHSSWDDGMQLANVSFLTSFFSRRSATPSQLSSAGTPSRRALSLLSVSQRHQWYQETVTSCMEGVLSLCLRADAQISERA